MNRNEVIANLIKLRRRCERLKCSTAGNTEEWVRAEEALHYAVYALIWGIEAAGKNAKSDCAHFIRAQRWIPVTERPPEKEGWYLVFSVTFKDVAFFALSEGWCRLNTREGRMEPYPYRVTHWMPLPEPPKSEGKKKNEKI